MKKLDNTALSISFWLSRGLATVVNHIRLTNNNKVNNRDDGIQPAGNMPSGCQSC